MLSACALAFVFLALIAVTPGRIDASHSFQPSWRGSRPGRLRSGPERVRLENERMEQGAGALACGLGTDARRLRHKPSY